MLISNKLPIMKLKNVIVFVCKWDFFNKFSDIKHSKQLQYLYKKIFMYYIF